MWRPCPAGGPAAEAAALEARASKLLSGPIKASFTSLRNFVKGKYLPAVEAVRKGSIACADLPNGQAM